MPPQSRKRSLPPHGRNEAIKKLAFGVNCLIQVHSIFQHNAQLPNDSSGIQPVALVQEALEASQAGLSYLISEDRKSLESQDEVAVASRPPDPVVGQNERRTPDIPRMVTTTAPHAENDGHKWLKYGKKDIKGEHSRTYFKCKDCCKRIEKFHRYEGAVKQVQQCDNGERPNYLVTFLRQHSCTIATESPRPPPPPRPMHVPAPLSSILEENQNADAVPEVYLADMNFSNMPIMINPFVSLVEQEAIRPSNSGTIESPSNIMIKADPITTPTLPEVRSLNTASAVNFSEQPLEDQDVVRAIESLRNLMEEDPITTPTLPEVGSLNTASAVNFSEQPLEDQDVVRAIESLRNMIEEDPTTPTLPVEADVGSLNSTCPYIPGMDSSICYSPEYYEPNFLDTVLWTSPPDYYYGDDFPDTSLWTAPV